MILWRCSNACTINTEFIVDLIFHKMLLSWDMKNSCVSSPCNFTEWLQGAIWLVRTVKIQGSSLICLSLTPDWFCVGSSESPLAVAHASPDSAELASSAYIRLPSSRKRSDQSFSLLLSGCKLRRRKWWWADPGEGLRPPQGLRTVIDGAH